MTKNKIFMALGSLVLATSAFVAFKPSQKASAAKTGYGRVLFPGVTVKGLTSFAPGLKTAQLATAGGSVETLRTTPASGGNKLYFKP